MNRVNASFFILFTSTLFALQRIKKCEWLAATLMQMMEWQIQSRFKKENIILERKDVRVITVTQLQNKIENL